MVNKNFEEIIKKISVSLNKRFNDYNGLYLFGAYLDGKNHPDEDIEIVALFGNTNKEKRENIWPIIGKIETEYDITIDLYPYTEEEFKQDEELYKEVISEGVFYDTKGNKKRV